MVIHCTIPAQKRVLLFFVFSFFYLNYFEYCRGVFLWFFFFVTVHLTLGWAFKLVIRGFDRLVGSCMPIGLISRPVNLWQEPLWHLLFVQLVTEFCFFLMAISIFLVPLKRSCRFIACI